MTPTAYRVVKIVLLVSKTFTLLIFLDTARGGRLEEKTSEIKSERERVSMRAKLVRVCVKVCITPHDNNESVFFCILFISEHDVTGHVYICIYTHVHMYTRTHTYEHARNHTRKLEYTRTHGARTH